MSLDSSNIRVGVTGAVSLNTGSGVAPVDADSALGTGWVDLGYANEDGVSETRDRTTNRIKAWQNAAVVRTVVTEAAMRITVTLIESKKDVLEAFYAATADSAGGLVIDPFTTGGRKKWCVDVVDGTDYIRSYIPQGELVEPPADVVAASGDPIGYQMVIDAYPDAALGGSVKKFYSSLATAAAAPTIESVTPSAAAEAELVVIRGTSFTGTTAVKFGGTDAADYSVVDPTTIVAALPAGSAGSAAVTVTNATGTSSSFAYTRAA